SVGSFVAAPGWLAILPATLSGDPVQVWDPAAGTLLHTLGHSDSPAVGTAAPDRSWLAFPDRVGAGHWGLPAGIKRLTIPRNRSVLAASPDGRWLAVAGHQDAATRPPYPGEIRIYHTADGHTAAMLPTATPPTSCCWAPTGTTLYTASPSGCYAFDWVTGTRPD